MSEDLDKCRYWTLRKGCGYRFCGTHVRAMYDHNWCWGSRVSYVLIAVGKA